MRYAVVGIVLLAIALSTHAGGPEAGVGREIQRLKDATGGTAQVSVHAATGVARFVRLVPGSLALSGPTPERRAADFFERHGAILGISDAATELGAAEVRVDTYGATHVTLNQVYRGIPVFAAVVRVHFDGAGRLTVVNGTFVPGIAVAPRPVRTRDEAAAIAITDVLSRLERTPLALVEARSNRLVIFRSGLVQRVAGRDHLSWMVEAGNGHDVRETLFVDAHSGKIVERIAGIHETLDRKIHETPPTRRSGLSIRHSALPLSCRRNCRQ